MEEDEEEGSAYDVQNDRETPANWTYQKSLIVIPLQTFEELQKRQKKIEENRFSWYLSFAKNNRTGKVMLKKL